MISRFFALPPLAPALLLSLLVHVALLFLWGLPPNGGGPVHAVLQLHLRPAGVDAPMPLPEKVPESVPPVMETRSTKPVLAKSPEKTPRVQRPAASRAVVAAEATDQTSAREPRDNLAPSRSDLPGEGGILRRAEIEFEVFTGEERLPAGKVQHRFVSDQNAYFGLSVVPSDAAAGSLEVSGEIGSQGLRPSAFTLNGELPERLVALHEVGKGAEGVRSGQMRDRMLDRQSLIYQFMANPPLLTGGELWLSDGRKNALFSYRFAVAGAMTALGGVRAVKLELRPADGAELIELWLVPEMHYLPVRVRHTDQHGEVTEQVAVSLDFSRQ